MTPRLSVLVIVHDMPRQAMNTLYSLSLDHQRDVGESDYEVVVVENASDSNLDEAEVLSLAGTFRYLRRTEPGVSPAPAVNEGLSLCRGELLGLMVDGAHLVTPRVVRYGLDGLAISSKALVAVPGYHLGRSAQHRHRSSGYDEEVERALLASVDWRVDGYALFDIACASDATPRGVFHPLLESNCMFAPHDAFEEIGGADERFDLRGGGGLNLHLYRALGMRPDCRLIVLPGEGSFHQFHGGVTTAHDENRGPMLRSHRDQLGMIWGETFYSLRREPMMLGAVEERAMGVLEWSAGCEIQRHRWNVRKGLQPWPDDPASPVGGSAR